DFAGRVIVPRMKADGADEGHQRGKTERRRQNRRTPLARDQVEKSKQTERGRRGGNRNDGELIVIMNVITSGDENQIGGESCHTQHLAPSSLAHSKPHTVYD